MIKSSTPPKTRLNSSDHRALQPDLAKHMLSDFNAAENDGGQLMLSEPPAIEKHGFRSYKFRSNAK